MRLAVTCAVAVLTASAMPTGSEAPVNPRNGPIETAAVTCFLSGEQVSGMNKICFYDCLGDTAAITVSSVALCPLSIKR